MSKAFVIKNKEGKYYRESDVGLNFTTILSNANMFTDKIDAEMWVKENLILKGCKVQAITIYEGDPLMLACYETDNYWNEQKAFEKKMTLYDYFIQQAKESEKDERD